MVIPAEMGHKKAVADDLLGDIPDTAIQHGHSFAMQAFAINKELADKTKEAAALQRTINKAETKMKNLTDQAEAAKKAQEHAEEKADAAKAIAAKAIAKAIQHGHSFAMQAFAINKELADKTKEAAALQRTINKAETKMKNLTDQAEAAKKAQEHAEEKADAAKAIAAKAIAKVLAAEKKETEAKMAEAQKKL
ncbi:uncharacterized protein LOC114292155 [Camellia sinensis]|uniref:uncharacterized protein LOC114292155 n=1 Tax=Camellia sinensis TaxID=4442 RepID=UPI0010368878|nr:uncharacterized protein LOC114292155 [Camellia sinensis]